MSKRKKSYAHHCCCDYHNIKMLRTKRIKTVHTDDVAVLMVGKDLQTISDIMKATLKMISVWVDEKGG